MDVVFSTINFPVPFGPARKKYHTCTPLSFDRRGPYNLKSAGHVVITRGRTTLNVPMNDFNRSFRERRIHKAQVNLENRRDIFVVHELSGSSKAQLYSIFEKNHNGT